MPLVDGIIIRRLEKTIMLEQRLNYSYESTERESPIRFYGIGVHNNLVRIFTHKGCESEIRVPKAHDCNFSPTFAAILVPLLTD